ncbi:Wzz/FepE/Etk N-terminal domain-containing protein [Thioalkalivibrio sp. XN279]|uniref:Wzz/FepE/Etk N-terminal domain-containing protein n=1 Tax=Thioalkalivibrio sp. XN279 TaxID=2714953 RepID=UPI001409CE98|nr:Wzz/FepE/Etk N-terminal domain-containing protein [Thioalkalivibrio sp. XN279]NHA15459.1 hypothetical protein [Thioalkalivibrio sp. XN279]
MTTEEKLHQGSPAGQRLVYVMPEQALGGLHDDHMGLRELWNATWRGKWLIIAVTSVFTVSAVTYALTASQWYRAEVVLAPAEEETSASLGGQLGGLAALAGVSVGGRGSAEAIAGLKSREFAREFIEDFDLLPVFFAEKWDSQQERWRGDAPEEWPDVRDAVRYFHENVLEVSEDGQTRMVTLGVEWTQPELAAEWANALVQRLNSRLRERALREAEANVAYLQSEFARANVVTLQQSIGRLLESELQKLMLARGNDDFAFRVVDAASPPKQSVRPKRTLIVLVGTFLGGALGVFSVLIVHLIRSEQK